MFVLSTSQYIWHHTRSKTAVLEFTSMLHTYCIPLKHSTEVRHILWVFWLPGIILFLFISTSVCLQSS